MEPVDWLKEHQVEIAEHWRHRVRPVALELGGDSLWEKRIDSAFEQICVLLAEGRAGVADADVEARLFQCERIKGEENHRFSAELLASGRRAIGDVSGTSGDPEALRCAGDCGNVIDYLQAMLRMNICRDCNEINCCMRLESLEPMSGEARE